MNRRTVLKALAATPLAMACPPVPAAKPDWMNWEGKIKGMHFVHVRIDPEDVALDLTSKKVRWLARPPEMTVEELPPQWLLKDCTLICEKFYAALGRVKSPDYARPILANPVDEARSWGEWMPGGYYLIRGAEVSTHDAYEWPKGAYGLHPAVASGAVLLEALWHRSNELAKRTGRRPCWETIHTLTLQVPVSEGA